MKVARLQHKKGRKSNYSKTLNNDYHREVRRKALLRDNFMCKDCGSKLNLELHHLTYLHKGNELEFMQDVVILCGICHQKRHNKTK